MENTTEQRKIIEAIIADTRKEAVWIDNNKYSRRPIHDDIGMSMEVAVERIEKIIALRVNMAYDQGWVTALKSVGGVDE